MYTYVIIRVSTLNNICGGGYFKKKGGGGGGGGGGWGRVYDKSAADAGAVGGCAGSLMGGT